MNKLLLLALLLTLAFSCKSNSQSDAPTSNDIQNNSTENTKEMNTAIKFHIESAAKDIRTAIDIANADNIALYKSHVLFNAITIQNAIKFCEEQNETELGEKLKALDARLSQVFVDSISSQQKLDEIHAVCNDLDALLK
jgi:hypothetical protein